MGDRRRQHRGPTALVLSRQKLPMLAGGGIDEMRDNGFRVVHGAAGRADVVLAASGSEVALALDAADLLAGRGVDATVISVMWRERLEQALSVRSICPTPRWSGQKPACRPGGAHRA